ncbi:MAG: RNA polymerase sigma factor [Pseudomonas sp.]
MSDRNEDDARRQWFRQKVLPLESHLRHIARRFASGNTQDVEDLVHDTFLRMLGNTAWRSIDNPASFAIRTLQNLAIDTLRRRKVVAFDVISDLNNLDAPDMMPGPEESASQRGELERLARMISELPPQCRQVFMLRKVDGLSHREISERMNISISTVEKHLSKGLRLCTDRLAGNDRNATRQQERLTCQPLNPLSAKK